MKYGESTFDILYLLTAIICGIKILMYKKDKASALMGAAVLTLGLGDAFHLVPRVLNYFADADFTMALGVGKLVTSITMTVFYVLMYHIYLRLYSKQEIKGLSRTVYALAAVRVLLCLLPQNNWLENESSALWGAIRNIPFAALGIVIIYLYFKNRSDNNSFKRVWLYVLLSFAFYIPVAVAAGIVPILGMLMLPKTVCYILIIFVFLKYAESEGNK